MKMQIVFGGRCAGKSILKRLIAEHAKRPMVIGFDEAEGKDWSEQYKQIFKPECNSAMLQINQAFKTPNINAEELQKSIQRFNAFLPTAKEAFENITKAFQDMRVKKVVMSQERFKREYLCNFEAEQPEYDENYKVIK